MGGKPRITSHSTSFWPCQLVELDDGVASITFTAFDLTESHFGGRDAGGYAIEGLPTMPVSGAQKARLDALSSARPADRREAARRINAEARARVRNWTDYLGDPRTITLLLEALARERDTKVYEELLWALAFIVERHLPDLRTRPVFERALSHPRANMRWIAVVGATELYEVSWGKVLGLRGDRAKKVRDAVARSTRVFGPFPIWMFETELDRGTPPPIVLHD